MAADDAKVKEIVHTGSQPGPDATIDVGAQLYPALLARRPMI
jgi:hypothetical protein